MAVTVTTTDPYNHRDTFDSGASWIVDKDRGLTVFDAQSKVLAQYPYSGWNGVRHVADAKP